MGNSFTTDPPPPCSQIVEGGEDDAASPAATGAVTEAPLGDDGNGDDAIVTPIKHVRIATVVTLRVEGKART